MLKDYLKTIFCINGKKNLSKHSNLNLNQFDFSLPSKLLQIDKKILIAKKQLFVNVRC